MALKVSYKQGSKATYLGLLARDPNALYFCTDTHELFRGDDLYSDGLRVVESFQALPTYALAADGILYFCKDTGCGFVLNEARDGWLPVVHGIDNDTIVVNDNGLMRVNIIPFSSVSGLEEKLSEIEQRIVTSGAISGTSDELAISDDGTLSIRAVEQVKIVGLEDRLANIEKSIVGGIRYCGSVETFDNLPTGAETGDLYEVREDNSEWCWNGEQWFEYGKTTDHEAYATKSEVRAIAQMVGYEVAYKPEGTLVNYSDEEIRIMCAVDTAWTHQNSGENSDANSYYIGFKAYAPSDDVVSFKEDLAEIISDETMYYFENNEFAGVDEYGRKYSVVWLPVAVYDENVQTWTYYGANSSTQKYIGWDYSVEWFNASGIKVAADTIRINLANENCYTTTSPHYVSRLEAQIAELEQGYTWGDM